MIKFNYVEDYIEFFAGDRDAAGTLIGLFDSHKSPISLARYDIAIVSSLSSQVVHHNKAYTDKQADLAKRLVIKYTRQLSRLSPPVAVPDDLQFRMGIRVVDRTKSITETDEYYVMRFPYDNDFINTIKKQIKEGQGKILFDKELRAWCLAKTEYNLNWLVTIAPTYEFEIAPSILAQYDQLTEVEAKGYTIELIQTGDHYTITNAADSLIDYVNSKLGGFGLDNLLTLVDNSSVLGYNVNQDLLNTLYSMYDPDTVDYLTERVVSKETDKLGSIVKYAKLVNRLPVYIYDNAADRVVVDDPAVVYLARTSPSDLQPKLIVTHTAMMIGSKKQSWLANSEKIIKLE